jgi:hypothetical protein
MWGLQEGLGLLMVFSGFFTVVFLGGSVWLKRNA